MTQKDPFQPLDDNARALARRLIDQARFGALAVISPDTGAPSVTRIAVATDPDGAPLTLISTLASHTGALQADPRCSLLLGEPGPRGDPLTHPRLTLDCTAHITDKAPLRDHYLAQHPKAKLYIDSSDFLMVRLDIQSALLNGGFGKAFRMTATDF